jgi:antibiotic biosynthesis monooxygenase (ABM) superfamily enzyme
LNNPSYNADRNPREAIEVISRNIKPGHEKHYDDWLRRYMLLENKAPGYLPECD